MERIPQQESVVLRVQPRHMAIMCLIFAIGLYRGSSYTRTEILNGSHVRNNGQRLSEIPTHDGKKRRLARRATPNTLKRYLDPDYIPERPLEFNHITKTGGSTLELISSSKGISWGACRENKAAKRLKNCNNSGIRGFNYPITMNLPPSLGNFSMCEPWHVPHHWYDPDIYNGSDTFAVVRNPYDRMLSEFYCPWTGHSKLAIGRDRMKKRKVRHSVEGLNQFLVHRIKERWSHQCGHMLAQHYFVYDDDLNQRTTHVVHFESMEEEFPALMKAYGLNLTLPNRTINSGSYTDVDERLTIANLTDETIRIINENAGPTFDVFGYKRVESATEFSSQDIERSLLEYTLLKH